MPVVTRTEPDPALFAAVDVARAAAVDEAGAEVGERLSVRRSSPTWSGWSATGSRPSRPVIAAGSGR